MLLSQQISKSAPGGPIMYQRILAPIDGSEIAQRAFDFALALARESGAELIPLFVIDVPIIAYQAPGLDPSIVRRAGKQRELCGNCQNDRELSAINLCAGSL
jgi:Universal stress protein family